METQQKCSFVEGTTSCKWGFREIGVDVMRKYRDKEKERVKVHDAADSARSKFAVCKNQV